MFPLLFVPVLCAIWAGTEAAVPEITLTGYHAQSKSIKSTVAENPDRPLGIVLGSSRVVHAFQPEQLSDTNEGALWVSAAHMGAGPALNRLILNRLLRDGVRPAVVVIELMPTFFAKENEGFVTAHFAMTDMPLMRRYGNDPFSYDYHFMRHRFRRAGDITRVSEPFAGHREPGPRGGYPTFEDEITADERAKRLAHAADHASVLQRSIVRPAADRALRDTLREAADHGIRVVLLRMPEGPLFRGWYAPARLAEFDEYVSRVSAEYGTSVIDARLWLEEGDFHDSHHVLKRGAEKFTARFGREMQAILSR